ncbi:SAP domain-containing ribonucleoprotein-like isoform X1 [Penaeus chinensis]|uniref:SAP domain-containing ribonucleoprotein-like isoform X1 n=1 Tax=Penaeus chinensis TaxID=139456 RepID=UPI001FB7B6A6|nr:SAP domain-containing ribonucleoprotein-like isoform X1 [Penaeus chinensis]
MDDASQISKMKVADLKKELKARGLPVTGNKNELVERLQEALEADGNVPLGTVDGEDEEFDEEEILGGDDDMDAVDIGKLTPQEEAAALGVNISVRDELNSTDLNQVSTMLEQPEKKKISLKRSEPPVPTAPTTPPPTEASKENTSPESQSEGQEDGVPSKKLIRLSSTENKTHIEARAERFGIPLNEEARKQARAERFAGNSTTTAVNKKPAKLSMETGGTDIEKLKARAKRFGEVTSKSLTKVTCNVSELEKMKQRQERFAAGGTETKPAGTEKVAITSPDDAKAARAARFTASSSSEDEIKKKRAERFGTQ